MTRDELIELFSAHFGDAPWEIADALLDELYAVASHVPVEDRTVQRG